MTMMKSDSKAGEQEKYYRAGISSSAERRAMQEVAGFELSHENYYLRQAANIISLHLGHSL